MKINVLCGLAAACIVGVTLFSAGASAASRSAADDDSSIALAQAFNEALNAHDVNAVVDLFTEANSGATVNADRYAWQKYEIRMWAQQQASANIQVDAFDYRLTEHGAEWTANLYRDDFGEPVPVTGSIWLFDGKIADFTSVLNDPRDASRLGALWQPGVLIEPSGDL